jgi:NAD(P)-dependent dehydrogenase (short-subunit alcohol dehydrogenase family)
VKDKQPSFRLTGQVALVTASARGIGKACALALAEAGADIILGLKTKASGQALVKQIQKLGREALPVQMDRDWGAQSRGTCDRE